LATRAVDDALGRAVADPPDQEVTAVCARHYLRFAPIARAQNALGEQFHIEAVSLRPLDRTHKNLAATLRKLLVSSPIAATTAYVSLVLVLLIASSLIV